MTEYAIPGEARHGLPAGIEASEGGTDPVTLPWLCPGCGEVVAETFVSNMAPDRARTVMIGFSPIRLPDADRDGVPFFGLSRRTIRGKGERRAQLRLANAAWAHVENARRGGPRLPVDHDPIESATSRPFA